MSLPPWILKLVFFLPEGVELVLPTFPTTSEEESSSPCPSPCQGFSFPPLLAIGGGLLWGSEIHNECSSHIPHLTLKLLSLSPNLPPLLASFFPFSTTLYALSG